MSSLARTTSLTLIKINLLCIEYVIAASVPEAFVLNLDSKIGNSEGSFDVNGRNFSHSSRGVVLHNSILHAQLTTSGGVWWNDHLAIDIEFPSDCKTGTEPLVTFRRLDARGLQHCRYLRLLGGFLLAAQCLHTDGSYRDSYLDLDTCLGVHNGEFSKNGKWFSGDVEQPEVTGTILQAYLSHDGTTRRDFIDLANIVQVKEGSLMPLREVLSKDLDFEILRDSPFDQYWLPGTKNVRLLNYRQKRAWYLLASCSTPIGVYEYLLRLNHIVGPSIDEAFSIPAFSTPDIPETARETRLANGILTASFMVANNSQEWAQRSIDLRELVNNGPSGLEIKRSGSDCHGCGNLFYAGFLYTPSRGCRIPIDLVAINSTRTHCTFCRLIYDAIKAFAPSLGRPKAWIETAQAKLTGFKRPKRTVELVATAQDSSNRLYNILKSKSKTSSTEIRCTILIEPGTSRAATEQNAKSNTGPKRFRTLVENAAGPSWTDSDRRWGVVEEWIGKCSTEHDNCRAASIPELPSRYLDIGLSEHDPVKVVASTSGHGIYACLSHCWGGKNECKLTEQNQALYMQAIPTSHLPPVFKDAIAVCRRLGFRRLWIDSLCIRQDNEEDWQRESQKMGGYYSACAIAIAATGCANSDMSFHLGRKSAAVRAAGFDSQSGPFSLLAYPSHLAKRGAHFVHAREPESLLRDFPLLTRAWVLQERWLAPRFLHFCGTEIIFECGEMTVCECGGVTEPMSDNIDYQGKELRATTTTLDGLVVRRGHLSSFAWTALVSTYSAMEMTFYSDRLVAISGIVSVMYKAQVGSTDDGGNSPTTSYLAGLWRKTLDRDMAWFVGKTLLCTKRGKKTFEIVGGGSELRPKPKQYLAPSWSWASVLNPVRYIEGLRREPLFEVLDTHITLTSDNPFGSVNEGCVLHLRGKMLETSWDLSPGPDGTRSFLLNDLLGTQQLDQEDVYGMAFSPDFAIHKVGPGHVPRSCKLYVFPLANHQVFFNLHYSDMDLGQCQSTVCLVLRELDGFSEWKGVPVYQRVGFVEYANLTFKDSPKGTRNLDRNEYVPRELFVV